MTDGFHGFKRPEIHFSITKKAGPKPIGWTARLA
jgi:hypothetical protein